MGIADVWNVGLNRYNLYHVLDVVAESVERRLPVSKVESSNPRQVIKPMTEFIFVARHEVALLQVCTSPNVTLDITGCKTKKKQAVLCLILCGLFLLGCLRF